MLTRLRCLSFLLAGLFPLLSACQADGEPTGDTRPVDSGQDNGNVEDGDQGIDDSDGDDGAGNDDNADEGDDNDNDNEDDGDNGDDSSLTASDCDAHADFLPLTKGLPALDIKVKAKAEIDDGCRNCEIRDENAVVEPNLLKSARMMTPAGAAEGVNIHVELDDERYGIEQAGFMVAAPDRSLSDTLLENIELSLLHDDDSTERVRGGRDELKVYDTSDSYRQLLIIETDEPFDEMRIRMSGNAESSAVLEVYAACVNHYGWDDDDDD